MALRLSDIKKWILEGATDREICERLDISHDTWYRYMKEYKIQSDLVSMWKSVMDSRVEKAKKCQPPNANAYPFG